ncbi:MAG: ornithine carbamoyltransferase [Coriobacteriales bacterium]|jgi:ornithine carbamoyltransferase|nr:ornithine carbamoyltransferase [Coriobacteriales bacterium]
MTDGHLPNWATLGNEPEAKQDKRDEPGTLGLSPAPPPPKDNPLAGRDLLRLLDLTPREFYLVLSRALANKRFWKADAAAAQKQAPYAGRAVGIILEKPSLRTRVSFELAAARLGAYPVVMSDTHSAFSRGESVKDTTMVMERFVDAIVIRSFAQARVEEIAHWASIPVVNALTDDFHPCQGLADFLTMHEYKGDLSKLVLAYVGDGNNMAHTYLEGAALCGMEVRIATPEAYRPREDYIRQCQALAAQTGAKLIIGTDPLAALAGADVVITDTWASMGAEAEHDERVRAFEPYRISAASFEHAAPGAIFLHCLPAHRGEEVTDEVMDAPFSAIYDEAENRLHAQQALLELVLG